MSHGNGPSLIMLNGYSSMLSSEERALVLAKIVAATPHGVAATDKTKKINNNSLPSRAEIKAEQRYPHGLGCSDIF